MSEIKEYLQNYMDGDSDFLLTDSDFANIIEELNEKDRIIEKYNKLQNAFLEVIVAISDEIEMAGKMEVLRAYKRTLDIIKEKLTGNN